MKYKMLTGAAMEEIMNTNIFEFFTLLGASEAVISEDSIRLMKIYDNKLLLKSKKNASQYPDLMKYHKRVYTEKGVKQWRKKADIAGLERLKDMVGKG
jgi:hypothetical protein